MNNLPTFKFGILAQLVSLVFGLSVNSGSAQLTVTTSDQEGALPLTPTWRPASDSLIAGVFPASASGNFSLEANGRNVNSLTTGGNLMISQIAGNTTSTNYVTCGNGGGAGSLVIYPLPSSANGFSLTNITVYGGWKDNGRDAQAYTVSYSTVLDPTVFIVLTTVNYNPSVPASTASATRVVLAGAGGGVIASNVASVKFDFTSPASENGYTGYGAITVEGTNTAAPSGSPLTFPPAESPVNANLGVTPGTSVTLKAAATGSPPIGYQWQTDGGSGGTFTNIPAATAAALTINTTDYALGAYRYQYVAANSFGTNTSPAVTIALVVMVDIGSGAPAVGPQDISQLLNTDQLDDGINYYSDDGANYGHWCGQTFTTGTNPNGYVVQTLAWKSAGNGNDFGVYQPYDLYFYSISADGNLATAIASYQGYGGGTEDDWFQWRGLNVPLAPHQVYGYAFGRDAASSGWEHMGDQGGNPYSGGQIMSVANTMGTGPVTYGPSGGSDATFDIGLNIYTNSSPFAETPAFTPDISSIYAGMAVSITLNETALGVTPFTYQWLTDNGTGGALIPVPGATGASLVINTASSAAGSYKYSVTVSNANGSSTSAALTVAVLPASAPTIVADIAPAPANQVGIGQTLIYSTAFTGTPPITYQWYVDSGNGPVPISTAGNASATSNTLVLANVQWTNSGIYFVTAQNSAGSTSSSESTLVVTSTVPTSLPLTYPAENLLISTNGPGNVNLIWSQGTLLQSTNIFGPWTPIASVLELTNFPVSTVASAMFYKVAVASEPRIVNIFNFVRDQDYRVANSQQVLYDVTANQVQLVRQANLPATFALQYDALMDTNYQSLFKQQLGTNDEIAAWWEIPQELVERAGLVWRGQQEWDPTSDVDFSCGYTPAERIQLVDAYMADFKTIFGFYPKTVGSWYIDEVTLAYMESKYGVIASANCKDQIGTDSYTLWGSYWNQAYYPSVLNAYMPAQTLAGQINVPVFRMLGSDPIYQYGNYSPGVLTLEPVYSSAGGSADWVAWFMNNLVVEPSLAFGYTQAGQENDIDGGWTAQQNGLTRQVALFSAQAAAGEIQVKTMAQAGQWFRDHFSLTPPTSVVALDDWQDSGHKSVWYDSRFYRLNVLWTNGAFYIRDLHCFNEDVVSPTHTVALTTSTFDYETLPVMDGGQWSGSSPVGIWPVLVATNGAISPLVPQGQSIVKEVSPTDLSIQQSLSNGGIFTILCCETNVTFTGTDGKGQPLSWAWILSGGTQQESAIQIVTSNSVAYAYAGASYQVQLAPGAGSFQKIDSQNIQIVPNPLGKIILDLDVTR